MSFYLIAIFVFSPVFVFPVDATDLPRSIDNSARPFWVEKSSYVEGKTLYAVGIAANINNLAAGRQKAWKFGKREISNFVQITDLSGVVIKTKMTYEEVNSNGTYNVYRLMSVDLPKLYHWKSVLLKKGILSLKAQNQRMSQEIDHRNQAIKNLEETTRNLRARNEGITQEVDLRDQEILKLERNTRKLIERSKRITKTIHVRKQQVQILEHQAEELTDLEQRAAQIEGKVNAYNERVRKYIRCGMTKEEVESVMGEPRGVDDGSLNIGIEVLNYGSEWLDFRNGILGGISQNSAFASVSTNCP